ncbi:B12-binding domain-containing radical SAM protein [Campylobacterota bacterium]|nr:B12-binding domain-containing radical SAM protein [Campylobacterota bacterium]
MLGVLAALTPADVEITLYDDRMEQVDYDEPTDLAAITVETFTARRAYEIAAEYRARGVKVIMGGMHATLLPDEVAAHADSVFTGDAELLWATVIDDARHNRLKPRYHAPAGVGQRAANGACVLPRRDLFRGKGYLPISLMQFSRGCRFACSFCAISRYFDRRHYHRRIDEVVREIAEQKVRLAFFVDDNIASNAAALKELCRELIPLKVGWVSQASLDITRDAELMRLLADSGCLGNVMGFESITAESLRDAHKSANLTSSDGYKRDIEILRDHGMQTWAAFTLGYDHDTPTSIGETERFARESRFTFAAFNILMPYPNTPFYHALAGEGRLLYGGRWWLHPEYRFNHAAFTPANMSADDLTRLCHEARSSFNSLPSIVRRFGDLKTNMRTLWRAALYWRYTLLFRSEVHRKHSMRFGLR